LPGKATLRWVVAVQAAVDQNAAGVDAPMVQQTHAFLRLQLLRTCHQHDDRVLGQSPQQFDGSVVPDPLELRQLLMILRAKVFESHVMQQRGRQTVEFRKEVLVASPVLPLNGPQRPESA
jgi:hypothetical protein